MQNRRVAVRAIILNDGKLLTVRLKNYSETATDDELDYWCTPGGGVDIGEPLVQALERELIEETGVKPVVGKLLYIQQYQYAGWEHLEFFFHVTNGEDYVTIDLEATTHGPIEIAEVDFVDPSTTNILPVFLTTEDLVADTSREITRVFNYIDDTVYNNTH